jgi:hypothetical protein
MTLDLIAAAGGFILIVLTAIFWRLPRTAAIGRRGEKRVAKKLSDLDSSVYKAFHDVLLPTAGGSSQIDHVVISAFGIFVIETKNFRGRLTGSLESETWLQHFGQKSYPLRNPVLQNRGHVTALMHALNVSERSLFVPLVVFAGSAEVQVPVVAIDYMEEAVSLVDRILSYAEPRLTDEQVRELCSRLRSARVKGGRASREHVRYARAQRRLAEDRRGRGLCPRCGGTLVLRQGAHGPFYGCSNYPGCRYTQDAG